MSMPKQLLAAKYGLSNAPEHGKPSMEEESPTITDRPGQALSLLIKDDYQSVAVKIFSNIGGVEIGSSPQTYDITTEEGFRALVARMYPFQIISTMRERTPFPRKLLEALPNLKLLMTTGMRNASIDLDAAAQCGVTVTGTNGRASTADVSIHVQPPPPAYDSTTQHTWALLLSLCSRIPEDDGRLRGASDAWQSGTSFALGGKIIGLLGLGKLGTNVARIACAFGMSVIAYSEHLTQDKADVAAEQAGLARGTFKAVSKEALFRQADVLSIHYVLSERSRGIVGREEFRMMKPSSILVNTSRGPLIDENALWDCLNEGGIRGAALDVYWVEPLPAESRWRAYKGKSQLVMSPHMGYVNEGTINRWYAEQAEIVKLWLHGQDVPNRLS